jgi:hypothetical protein
MSRLGDIITATANICAGVPGVARTYPMPSVLVSQADVPAVVVFTAGGPADFTALGLNRYRHDIRLLLLVAPMTAELDLQPLAVRTAGLLTALVEAFAQHMGLGQVDGSWWVDFSGVRYDGPKQVEYGGAQWVGAEIYLPILEFLATPVGV